MTGFDIVDRYDIAGLLLLEVVLAVALVLGAPLWAAGLALLIAYVAVFVRHFGQITGRRSHLVPHVYDTASCV